jgi:hypothetical protein
MKHISELDAEKALQNARGDSSVNGAQQRGASDQDRLDNLWAHMQSIYGGAWESKYGDVPSDGPGSVWLDALRNVSGRQIRLGLRCCTLRDSPFAPTPGEFLAMIFENDSRAHRSWDRAKALPTLPSDGETARRGVQALREALK